MNITKQQAQAFLDSYCIGRPPEQGAVSCLIVAVRSFGRKHASSVHDVEVAPDVWVAQDDVDDAVYGEDR